MRCCRDLAITSNSSDIVDAPPSFALSRTGLLKPWIDRLALKREHGEHAFVDAPERFAGDEALQRLVTKGEFAKGALPRTKPTGSTSSTSAASQRLSLASG
jgi:hypothetical protein